MTFASLFVEHWQDIEADLHDVYGIDVGDTRLMAARSWRWLQSRVAGLLSRPATYLVTGEKVQTIWSTRLQSALHEPAATVHPMTEEEQWP